MYQIEENGFVEDGHDTNRAFVRVSLTSVAMFLHLLGTGRLPPLSNSLVDRFG
jgi:hypothetical protein